MVRFWRMIGWLILIIGAALPIAVYGEEQLDNISSTQEFRSNEAILNFDTTFKTSIGLGFSFNGKAITPSESEEQVFSVTEPANLQLPPSHEIDLSRVQDLRKAGALSLAESLLVAGLSEREGQIDWFSWHKELWEVRDQNQKYRSLIESLEQLIDQTTGEQLLEVLERLARIHQKDGDFVTARAVMRDLLLTIDNDPIRVARLRRLLIHNYVDSGLLSDAEAASIRYQEEYLPDDTEWNLLRGQILIENMEPRNSWGYFHRVPGSPSKNVTAFPSGQN